MKMTEKGKILILIKNEKCNESGIAISDILLSNVSVVCFKFIFQNCCTDLNPFVKFNLKKKKAHKLFDLNFLHCFNYSQNFCFFC